MHELSLRLENPVVEGINDRGRQGYQVVFNGILTDGAVIRTGKELRVFHVTVRHAHSDGALHANGISVEDHRTEEACVDVTFAPAIVNRLMAMSDLEEATLALRFSDGGTRDERGTVFEAAGSPCAIEWNATRITRVEPVLCTIRIARMPKAGSSGLSTAV
ncbi:hypothetical protein [Luteibacter aegosomatissinici]|uniref:hypothetical protein n=1 Tax=Luteibacter aegosomatissinici TaxID=2911539 RepID=UPI001FFA9A52|nr:hypothetical protein [Luteibacter aegosomatissinici]UPG92765.1 hypothetical protein L2Y97_12910 [Luteibacter aegosomatissinici]